MKDADKTIAQIFWDRVHRNRDRSLFVFHSEGDFPPFTRRGKQRTMSWEAVGEAVEHIGIGLMELGTAKGANIAVMATTCPEWVMVDLALLSIGGRTGSIYPNNTPEQALYIINDLAAPIVFVEGAARRDGLLGLKARCPALKRIITIGCGPASDPLCLALEDLMTLGKAAAARRSAEFHERVAFGSLDDIAAFIYTSGTTGVPKGAVHNHRALTYTICTGAAWLPIEPGWTDLSFLPMAHIFEQFAGALLDIYRGDVTIAFARGIETVARDFGWVKPHFCRTAPRLLEKVHSAVWSKVEVLAGLTEAGFRKALEVARRVKIDGELYGGEIGDADRARYAQVEHEHFRHLRDLVFGGRLRFFVVGGAPLSQEINEFFWCLGLPVYELYGMTETGGASTNRPGHVRIGTVGQAWPGFDWPGGGSAIRLSPEGEVLVRGPNVMLGYHNQPEQSAAALRDGWMYSGDVAEVDGDGFFKITDRLKDILITAGGKNVAPVPIESLIKEDPLISQAFVVGDRRQYLTALVTLDGEELRARARRLGLRGTYAELALHPVIRETVEKIIQEKNRKLARYETIKRFRILDHELSVESGDLTPTMKVKRRKIYATYADLIENLYPQE